MKRKENIITDNKGALYLQVKDIIIQRIQQKIWPANTLIPTEQELMKEFGVSRTTIRQAIQILVVNGLLEKRQGRGTVVKPQKLQGSLGKLKGFAEEVLDSGRVPRSKTLRVEFRTDLFSEKSVLQLEESATVLLIERIRFADETPIALERTVWPEYIGKILVKHDLDHAKYYEILEEQNIWLRKASEQIKAINATLLEADYLGVRGGEALLEMVRLSFGVDDKPIEYTRTKYRSDHYHYDIDLQR
ncbi:GntR family transcriptional regulator [Salipaludibacillus keqinensis]|uniref:GntR family transcriptional regulator n=1 Tax=Salipaludibacillus keqinensis TaxID=2045207 RepID=A0A323TBR1_9BACI|nr:GntR family transcriptional regulator [Salipaludibacillus keqinensis]PYZ92621.1 GntR family transcriptional regulator [Salipaludibacillus keqinensis]